MIPDASAMDLSSSNEVMRACVSSLKLLFSSSSSHNQPSISHQAGLTIAPQRGPDASYLDKQVDELGQSVDTLISTFALLLSPHQAAQANRRSSSSYTYTSSHPAPLDASSFVAQAEQVLGSIRQLRDLYDQQQLLTEDPFPSFKPLSSSSDESSTTNIASINRVEEFEVHAEALTSSVLNALRSVSLLSQKKDMQLTLSPSPSPSKAITSSLSPPINNPQHPPPLPLLPTNSHPGAVLALFTAFLTKQNKDGNINSSGQSFDSNLSDANGSSVIELFHQFLKSPEAAAMVASGGAVRGVSLGGGGGGRGMDSSVTGEAGFPLPAADITSRQAVKALYSEPNDEHQRSKRPLKVELQLIDEEANDAESSGQHTAAPDREERVRIKLSLEAVHSGESLLPEKESGSSSSWDWHQAGAHFSSAATKMTAVAHHQPKDSNDTRSDQELMLMDLQRANYDLAFRMAELDHTIASLREENDHVTRMLVDLKVETAEKDNECMRLQQRLKKALRFENQVSLLMEKKTMYVHDALQLFLSDG